MSYRKIEQDKTKQNKKTELSVAEDKANQLTNHTHSGVQDICQMNLV